MQPASTSISAMRRDYGVKPWLKVFYILLGGLMLAGGVFFALQAFTGAKSASGALMGLPFIGIGVWVMVRTMSARVVIDGSRIEVHNGFSTRGAERSQIEGYRSISSRNGSFTQLCLRDGLGTINISSTFATDDDFRAWMQGLTDLDQRNRAEVLDRISQDQELGATPQERMGALQQARQWNFGLIAVSIAAAVAASFGPADLRLVAALLLTLAPVAAFLLLQRSPLLFSVFSPKADPRADVSAVLVASGLGLLFSAHGVEVVAMQPLLMMVVPVALLFMVAFLHAVHTSTSRGGAALSLLVLAGLYGYGAALAADTATDRAPASVYAAQVTGKHYSSGRSTTYYLHLTPWGPLEQANEIKVSSSKYHSAAEGDQVCLALHPGSLHVAWYQLVNCSGQSIVQP